MELTRKENERLVKMLSFYYENYVWETLHNQDSARAGEVDYEIRGIVKKLGIRELFPPEIKQRW